MSCILQSAFAWPLPAALILALVTLTQANSADLIQRSFQAAGPKPWASGPRKLERPISLLNSDYKTPPNITRPATNISRHTQGYCSGALRIHRSSLVLFTSIILVRLQSVSRTAVQTDNAFTSSGRIMPHAQYIMQWLSAITYQICKKRNRWSYLPELAGELHKGREREKNKSISKSRDCFLIQTKTEEKSRPNVIAVDRLTWQLLLHKDSHNITCRGLRLCLLFK